LVQHIQLNTVDSTNNFAKKLLKNNEISEITIISADLQEEGKGLHTTTWQSERGKNLLFSIVFPAISLKTDSLWNINLALSVAIAEFLEKHLKTNKIFIKWSNDIYVENDKICGILIENEIKNSLVENLIIGVGINVNQKNFPENIPNPTSMILKNSGNDAYNLIEVLDEISSFIISNINNILQNEISEIDTLKRYYSEHLLFANEMREYNFMGQNIMAQILFVDDFGRLFLELENGSVFEAKTKELGYFFSHSCPPLSSPPTPLHTGRGRVIVDD
jgi:BirA family biotin operon repressor/biotin-[acetyl-CoA-carboxylase] ligase